MFFGQITSVIYIKNKAGYVTCFFVEKVLKIGVKSFVKALIRNPVSGHLGLRGAGGVTGHSSFLNACSNGKGSHCLHDRDPLCLQKKLSFLAPLPSLFLAVWWGMLLFLLQEVMRIFSL